MLIKPIGPPSLFAMKARSVSRRRDRLVGFGLACEAVSDSTTSAEIAPSVATRSPNVGRLLQGSALQLRIGAIFDATVIIEPRTAINYKYHLLVSDI